MFASFRAFVLWCINSYSKWPFNLVRSSCLGGVQDTVNMHVTADSRRRSRALPVSMGPTLRLSLLAQAATSRVISFP